jgi:site-specific DNA-cytosine methylase
MYRSKQALTVSEPVQPRASDPYGQLRPLDAHLLDIFSMPAAQEEGLVVVEFPGISATTKALLRAGVKIKKRIDCETDPKAQAVTKARASDWLQVFPKLLKPSALEGFHSFLPQNVELIGNSHVLAMEKPDLIVAGFPCQGYSHASSQARGLADPRTRLFLETMRVIHFIHRRPGHCGWLIENVDATDHPIDSVKRES